jgi:pimeloyl-ACP methyl ester carboxylesterase
MTVVLVLLLLVGALGVYGGAYAAWANARWPAEGRFVRVGEARLHVMEQGEGPVVFGLHGASANALELWGPLAPRLEGQFRFIAMDRPGLGHSTRPPGSERLEVQASLAAAVLQDAGGGPAIIVAHSLGAATALRLALDRPDLVRALVLLSPASHPYPGDNAWYVRLAATPVVGPLFCATVVPAVAPFMSSSAVEGTFRPAEPPPNYADEAGLGLLFRPGAFCANSRDVTATKREFALQAPRYPEIDIPVIVITADRDRVVSPALHAEALVRDIPAAELVTLPGVGHMPQRVRPDAVVNAIERAAAMTDAPVDAERG